MEMLIGDLIREATRHYYSASGRKDLTALYKQLKGLSTCVKRCVIVTRMLRDKACTKMSLQIFEVTFECVQVQVHASCNWTLTLVHTKTCYIFKRFCFDTDAFVEYNKVMDSHGSSDCGAVTKKSSAVFTISDDTPLVELLSHPENPGRLFDMIAKIVST